MASSRQNDIILTERRPHPCRLSDSDVDYLLEHHRQHLELRPAGRSQFLLVPRGYAGIITMPHGRLQILPKIPMHNLLALLDCPSGGSIHEEHNAQPPCTLLVGALAAQLAVLMTAQGERGLQRAYRQTSGILPTPRGRINLARQIPIQSAKGVQFACDYDEFTTDVAINQIIKATAQRLMHVSLLSGNIKLQLAKALEFYAEISDIELSTEVMEQIDFTSIPAEYEALLRLCRVIVAAMFPSRSAKSVIAGSFLINLERAFEEYCGRFLKRCLANMGERVDLQLMIQPLHVTHTVPAKPPELTFRPDFVIYRNELPVAVLDTKWKRGPALRGDINQVLAYCTALGCARGFLLYPALRLRRWHYTFPKAGIDLFVQHLPIAASLQRCERGMEMFIRWLRRLATR